MTTRESLGTASREAVAANIIATAARLGGVPKWRHEQPPRLQRDMHRALVGAHPDIRYWGHGSSKFSLFLAPGAWLSPPDERVPNADKMVTRCAYITVHDIMEAKPMGEERRAIRERILSEGQAEGFEDKSPEYYQRELRAIFDRSDLQLCHILTGIEDGYPAHVYGVLHVGRPPVEQVA